jgi:TonB family protein
MREISRAKWTIALGGMASIVLGAHGQAQPPDETVVATVSDQPTSVEIYKEPRPKQLYRYDCSAAYAADSPWSACHVLDTGAEGWVRLGFMVDALGKPFEVTVIRSSGNKVFEQEAAKALERSTFAPASLNGKAIEGGSELTYMFSRQAIETPRGATPAFIRSYNALTAAINASDRTAADAALKRLKITNLYEDAQLGLAQYSYARKWGDELDQLEGLRRALAQADTAFYLRKDALREALLACLQLEVKTRDYAAAVGTWRRLSKLGVDKATEAQIAPVIDQLKRLQADSSSYDVQGLMPGGRWYLWLFKRHFAATVSEGSISEVKLRCEKSYVFFAFDPKKQYQVPSRYGSCAIEMEGTPGTRFTLTQY